MTDNLLTIENALFNLDDLRHLKEEKPDCFFCSRFNQEGIILITNLRLSFFYIDNDEFKYDHALFNLITKVYLEISPEDIYLDISYAYDKQKFRLSNRSDVNKIKNILEKNLDNKFEIREIDNPRTEKNYPVETTTDANYNNKNTENFITVDKKFGKSIKKHSIKYLKFAINIFILFFIISLISRLFPDLREKMIYQISYAFNFIKIQTAEKEINNIGASLVNHKGEKVYNLSDYMHRNFSKKYGTKEIDRDPWGTLYSFDYKGDKFKIISNGPDRKINTKDDISREFTKKNM